MYIDNPTPESKEFFPRDFVALLSLSEDDDDGTEEMKLCYGQSSLDLCLLKESIKPELLKEHTYMSVKSAALEEKIIIICLYGVWYYGGLTTELSKYYVVTFPKFEV